MPGRSLTIGIVAFWLVMTGWLAVREAWQYFGSRPTFQDALAASAAEGPVNWIILQDDQKIGEASTEAILDPQTGHYELEQRLRLDLNQFLNLRQLQQSLAKLVDLGPAVDAPLWMQLNSRYQVNILGELQAFNVEAKVAELQCQLRGRPVDRGSLRVVVVFSGLGDQEPLEQTIPYDGRDLILNGLCPLDRMPNLRAGQHWETPMVDPLEAIQRGMNPLSNQLGRAFNRPSIAVEVRSRPEEVLWQDTLVRCLVVDAKRSDVKLEIWVRQADGLVLKQKMMWGKTTLEIIREKKRDDK